MPTAKRAMFLLAAAASLALSGPAMAQAKKQTVEGAQAFLSSMLELPGVSRWLVVDGETRLVNGNPAKLVVSLTNYDHVDADGVKTPCSTRLTELDFANILLESNGAFYVRGESVLPPLPGRFAPPLFVNWGKVQVSRAVVTNPTGAWTTINAQFSGNARDPQPPMSFRLSTQDTGLADRIEYAMKFLQASCDITADTGF